MQIWCLLRHKYLQTAKIGIKERRFQFKKGGATFEESKLVKEKDAGGSIFPFYFSEQESEGILKLTKQVKERL